MIPAVPKYLGTEFNTAPPGHRFSLYFPVWDPESWEIEKSKKALALKEILRLPPESSKQIDALRERQQSLLLIHGENRYFTLEAVTTSPLVTGMGMEHPLENGFAFLNPYGIPYLPGSSIKGVLRRAADELAKNSRTNWSQAAIDQLFGHEDSSHARRGILTFWDSIPEIKGNALAMDVMTPHFGKYYQGDESPHDAGQPNPIVFMVIPPESKFSFHITADEKRNPGELKGGKWKSLLKSTFLHAFEWLGFGAKTSVGYGAFQIDPEVLQRQQERNRKELEDAKKKAEEANQQRAIDEKNARKKAEFDALPESRKAIIRAEEDINKAENHVDRRRRYTDIASILNKLVEQVRVWSNSDERKKVATFIEGQYDRIGWSAPGTRGDRRKKQEIKKRNLIDTIRAEGK